MFQGKVDEDNLKQSSAVVNAQVADSLGQLLEDLNMTDDKKDHKHTTDEETEDCTLQTEMEELGLPVAFGKQKKREGAKKKR